MRIFTMAALLALLPACAHAQSQAPSPANCAPLTLVNTIPMLRGLDGDEDFVPILFDGGWKYFLFDTGGDLTSITQVAADGMKLQLHNSFIAMQGVTSGAPAKLARVDRFVLGHLKSGQTYFQLSPNGLDADADGIFALDYLLNYDAEVDFGTDTLNFFSPDHCPGRVVYWHPSALAVLPMKVDGSFHIIVPVTIDGEKFDALIDSGATSTFLRADIAERRFHLTLGDADTPKMGVVNHDASFPFYQHIFKSLTFGDVAVGNPRVSIDPTGPDVVIGMNVLSKLHLYMAFKEKTLFISAASAGGKPTPFPPAYFTANIARWTGVAANDAQNPAAWSNRCFWRAAAKTELDGALTDCEHSLKLKADWAPGFFGKGLALYQQGKFQDAAAALDAAVAADTKNANYLFMRGLTKTALGDTPGGGVDMDLAKTLSPTIPAAFRKLGLAN